MRLLTFSVLRNCKFKAAWCQTSRKICNDTSPSQVEVDKVLEADLSLVEILPSWKENEEPELRATVMKDMRIIPNFVTEDEEASLMAELEPYLKRMRYEFDHWDNAIHGYRETERSKWNEDNARVLSRVRATAFSRDDEPLPHAHVLDLAAAGHIRPHVDAVRFCGAVIAGLCLASSAVMRLQHCARPQLQLDALLARRALYVMRGVARYEFTHAVLGAELSSWRGERVPRLRRVAVITRSRPPPAAEP